MTYIPKRDNMAKNLSLLSILTGFLLMMLSSVLQYRVIFQVLALTAVCAGIFMLQRYVLCEYRYIISDKDSGSSDLIVYRKQGKNDVKVCHISLFGVMDIFEKSAKSDKSALRYSYNQNMTGKFSTLVSNDGGRRVEITLEADETFVKMIRDRIGHGEASDGFAM